MTKDEEEGAPPARARLRPVRSRKQVVDKLWRAARRQIDAHEAHLADLPFGAPASEADAKALAVLARTVREAAAIDAAAPPETHSADDKPSTDGLRHAATLRAELARRLGALADRALGEAAAGPAAGDDV